MTETAETLRQNGGVDLTKLEIGVKVLVETTAGIYELLVTGPRGSVSVKATVTPFTAHNPTETRLEQSIWDDTGKVFIPYWIGKGMRMVFRDAQDDKLFATHSVVSAKVESADGTWTYEVWETEP